MSDVQVRLTLVDDASAKLNKVAKSAQKAATQMTTVGRNIDTAFQSSAPTSFASTAESAMSSVGSQAESLGDSIDSIFDGAEGGASAFSSQMQNAFNSASSGADEFGGAAQNAGDSMEELSSSAEELGENIEDIGGSNTGLDDLGEDASGAGKSMQKASTNAISFRDALKKLAAAVGVATAVKKVGEFMKDAVNIGSEFTSMMSEVQAISGASDSEVAQLEQLARDYGAATVFSATEAAEALKYMSLAGWDTSQMTEALGGVLNLAAASGMGLGEASDMVTDYLSAFGMKASQATYFADLLTYAQSNSNTTAAQLGEAYLNCAANMNAAGQDVETVTSLLEGMANQGVKGSRAGTMLAAMARDLTNNMEDGAVKIGDMTIAIADAQGNFRDFTDILTDVGTAVDGMGTAERSAALSSVFTSDSIKGVNMVLSEGIDNIAGYEEELRNSAGSAQAAADTMNNNLQGDVSEMSSAWEELKLKVFEGLEEPLREGVQYIASEVIPALSNWLPDAISSTTSMLSKVGEALKPLFNLLLKNPDKVGTVLASLGSSLVAIGAVKSVSKIANIGDDLLSVANGATEASTGLGKLALSIINNPWAAGAAAITAAAVAIGLAVKTWNDAQIDNSLNARFGVLDLDESQIEDFASRVIDAEWLVNINASINSFTKADELMEQAEEALETTRVLEWKCKVGMELTPDEQENYLSNIEEYAQAKVDELSERTYAAEITVKTMFQTEDGESFASAIEEWAAQDMADVSELQAQLTSLVENALTDGILDVDEQAAIDILESKINNILTSWNNAESQAQFDVIEQKYGRLSGKDLTADSFTSIVEELGEQRQAAAEALEENSVSFYSVLEAMNNAGRLEQTGYSLDEWKERYAEAARNMEATSLANSLDFESNTLTDTYGDKIEQNMQSIQDRTESAISQAEQFFENEDYSSLWDSLQYGYIQSMEGTNIFSDADQKALSRIYDKMKPDVADMQELIDSYSAAGQQVPQAVADSFNQAMEVGAAAGDMSAAWATYAKQMIADPANAALVSAIQEGTIGVPEELKTAIDRAMAVSNAGDAITIDTLTAELEGVEVDQDHVQKLLDEAVSESTAGLESSGEAVDAGTVTADVDVSASVDASQVAGSVEAATESAVSSADTNANVTTGVTVTAGETNTSEVTSLVQSNVDSTVGVNYDTNASTDVTLSETDNASEIYSAVGSNINSVFSSGYSTSASVTVHLNWRISNPTASLGISTSGSTATATISSAGYAEGGRIDNPIMAWLAEGGYPEYVIPMDGSSNAQDLWTQAGQEMGILDDQPISVSPGGTSGIIGAGSNSGGGTTDKNINLNINGNGSIKVSSNMSRDDVLSILVENVKDVLLNIIDQEILEEGDMAYDY